MQPRGKHPTPEEVREIIRRDQEWALTALIPYEIARKFQRIIDGESFTDEAGNDIDPARVRQGMLGEHAKRLTTICVGHFTEDGKVAQGPHPTGDKTREVGLMVQSLLIGRELYGLYSAERTEA